MKIAVHIEANSNERIAIAKLVKRMISTIYPESKIATKDDYELADWNDLLKPFDGGKEVPGATITHDGVGNNLDLTVEAKADDVTFTAGRLDDMCKIVSPLVDIVKGAKGIFQSMVTSLDVVGGTISEHFRRPSKYYYAALDDVDGSGQLIGAIYENDGYDTRLYTYRAISRNDGPVFDDVVKYLTAQVNVNDLPAVDNFDDANDAVRKLLDIAQEQYTRYHTAYYETTGDDREPAVVAVVFTEDFDGNRKLATSPDFSGYKIFGNIEPSYFEAELDDADYDDGDGYKTLAEAKKAFKATCNAASEHYKELTKPDSPEEETPSAI